MNARLSWVVYVKLAIVGFFASMLLTAAILFVLVKVVPGIAQYEYIQPITLAIVFLMVIGICSNARHAKLYTDHEGVWFYSGLFPWDRGSRGVLWSNFDQALYKTGMLNWLCNSHTIYLKSKYGDVIVVKDIWRGRKAIDQINQRRMF